MRKLILILLLAIATVSYLYFSKIKEGISTKKPTPVTNETPSIVEVKKQKLRLQKHANQLQQYALGKNYNPNFFFLVDMKEHSGKKRFFVYDTRNDSIMFAGLIAHGSCNTTFLQNPKFSNTPNEGCSSLGKYKVGNKYNGRFGTAFKLHGLDSSNSNAFRRFVVLHGYSCVPDKASYPFPICNSLGCPMVSYSFLTKLEKVIHDSRKPILLYIFN